MSDHQPECRAHDIPGWTIGDCICDRLRACEQRVRDSMTPYDVEVMEVTNRKVWEGRIFDRGYDKGVRDERKRSVLLIADAYGKGLDAAREAVAALPVAITVVHDCVFLNKQGMGVCENPDDYPHGIVQVAALAAIDALRGER